MIGAATGRWYVQGCPLGFLSESGYLVVRLLPHFAIGSESPAQLIAFVNKLFFCGPP